MPGSHISNAPTIVATGSLAWTPPIGSSGLSRPVLRRCALQRAITTPVPTCSRRRRRTVYTVVNGRIGIRGPDDRWALELWAQNLFNKDYAQVAFNSPFQEGGDAAVRSGFTDLRSFPGGRQIFSAFLAEPRTFGLTLPRTVRGAAAGSGGRSRRLRRRRRRRRRRPRPAPDGSVILATEACPVPPPPPPPPPPAPERG